MFEEYFKYNLYLLCIEFVLYKYIIHTYIYNVYYILFIIICTLWSIIYTILC